MFNIRILENSANDPVPQLRLRLVPPKHGSRSEWFLTSDWRNEAPEAVPKLLKRLQATGNRKSRTASYKLGPCKAQP